MISTRTNANTVLTSLLLLVISIVGVHSVSVDDVSFVGCYDTDNSINYSYPTVIEPLTWKACIHLCINKMTRYAGIQTSGHLCHCGNNIARDSQKTNNKLCAPCYEDARRQCGGLATMSLYQLTETKQMSFLLATDDGIKLLVNDTISALPIEGLTQAITAVDYHYAKQAVYFISKNIIMRLFSAVHDMEGHECVTTVTMMTRQLIIDIFQDYLFKGILKMTFDIHQELVYVIGYYESGDKRYLANTNYDHTIFKVVYSGPELSSPFALDVFNDEVVWGNHEDNKYSIYRGRVSVRAHLENITLLYQGSLKIMDIKIYHSEAQMTKTEYLCIEKSCSHSCTALSESVAHCTCPDKMILAEDSRTCEDVSSTTTEVTETSASIDTSTETMSSTYSGIERVITPEFKTTIKNTLFSETASKDNFELTMNTPVRLLECKHQDSYSDLFLIATTSLICILLILGFLLINIYLAINIIKQIKNKSSMSNCKISAELVELM